jgi:hypothetical protein
MSDNPYVIKTSEIADMTLSSNFTPNYTFIFGNVTKPEIGKMDFSGDRMVFTGDADEAAKLFLTMVDHYFQQRLKDEYNLGFKDGMERAFLPPGGLL